MFFTTKRLISILLALHVSSTWADLTLADYMIDQDQDDQSETDFVKSLLSSVLNTEEDKPFEDEDYPNYTANEDVPDIFFEFQKPKIQYFDSDGTDDEPIEYEKRSRGHRKDSRPVCETVKVSVSLREDDDYLYRPDHYTEEYCIRGIHHFEQDPTHQNKLFCYEPEQGCANQTEKVSFFKRRRTESCWKPFTKTVHVGCTCNMGEQRLDTKHYRP